MKRVKQWIKNKWDNPDPRLIKSTIYTSISVAILQFLVSYLLGSVRKEQMIMGTPLVDLIYMVTIAYAFMLALWNYRYITNEKISEIGKTLVAIASLVPVMTGIILFLF